MANVKRRGAQRHDACPGSARFEQVFEAGTFREKRWEVEEAEDPHALVVRVERSKPAIGFANSMAYSSSYECTRRRSKRISVGAQSGRATVVCQIA